MKVKINFLKEYMNKSDLNFFLDQNLVLDLERVLFRFNELRLLYLLTLERLDFIYYNIIFFHSIVLLYILFVVLSSCCCRGVYPPVQIRYHTSLMLLLPPSPSPLLLK